MRSNKTEMAENDFTSYDNEAEMTRKLGMIS